jgi:hypothetical protein
MTDTARLEDERGKCLQRLNGQVENAKSRSRLFFELAGIDARLGRAEDSIYSLREALVYAEELSNSLYFYSLRDLPDFQSLLAALEGHVDLNSPQKIIYAKGERERCVSEALICSICNDPLTLPLVHLDCGQMFCTACISPLSTCPLCQGSLVDPNSLIKQVTRLILNKLNALRAHCPQCFKIMDRPSINEHVKSCPVVCPHGCKQKVSPMDLENHSLVCIAVEVACTAADLQCPWTGTRRELAIHSNRCTYIKQRIVLMRVATLEEVNRELQASNRELQALARDLQARVAKLEQNETNQEDTQKENVVY